MKNQYFMAIIVIAVWLLAILSGSGHLSPAVPAVVTVILILIAYAGPLWKKYKKAAPHHDHITKQPKEEPHCVICENGNVDHMERDRQLRLAQLDDWLQAGIIDRAEYKVLKEKYENS